MSDYDFKYPETIFLENATGEEIVEVQNTINSSTDRRVVATQLFEWTNKFRTEDGIEHKLYDAFIYVKRKFKTVIDLGNK